jgi:hypothetical protein
MDGNTLLPIAIVFSSLRWPEHNMPQKAAVAMVMSIHGGAKGYIEMAKEISNHSISECSWLQYIDII